MKFLLSLVFLILSKSAFLQSTANEVKMVCDSVFMNDGSVQVVQIKELKKSKLIYVMCCEECAVPREIKLNTISEIVYAPRVEKQQEAIEEKPEAVEEKPEVIEKVKPSTFYIEDTVTGEIVIEKEVGDYLKITYKTEKGQEIKINGPIIAINKTSIVIDKTDIPLESIVMFHKKKRARNLLIGGVSAIGVGFVVYIIGALQPNPQSEGFSLGINGTEVLGGVIVVAGGGMMVTSGGIAAVQASKKAKRKNNPPVYVYKTYLKSTPNK